MIKHDETLRFLKLPEDLRAAVLRACDRLRPVYGERSGEAILAAVTWHCQHGGGEDAAVEALTGEWQGRPYPPA
jgi:hypothetical protein